MTDRRSDVEAAGTSAGVAGAGRALARQDQSAPDGHPRTKVKARLARLPRTAHPALSMTSQEAPLESPTAEADPLWRVTAALMRIVAIGWLAVTVLLWARLIGYEGTPMAGAWHALTRGWFLAVVPAVTAPIVAVGLWLLASWGVVVWLAALAFAVALASLAAPSAPLGWPALALNVAALLALAALLVVRYRRAAADEAD